MKKHILLFAFCLITLFSGAKPIDLKKATNIAAGFMKNSKKPQPISIPVCSTKSNLNQNIYIFNRGEKQGFVFISGDDNFPEVLGYTEQGDFDFEKMPPALLNWLDTYSYMIEYAKKMQITKPNKRESYTPKRSIKPLLTTHWHQYSPYNIKCPYIKGGTTHAVSGCVATAAAQLVYYWRKEAGKRTTYDTPTYNYGDAPVLESIPAGTPIQFELMQDIHTENTPSDMNEAVALFIHILGACAHSSYGNTTSAGMANVLKPFDLNFGLSGISTYKDIYSQEEWENMIYNDLSEGLPILYKGASPTQGAHAVVLDGYDALHNLFHFNFGWGGTGDGYFTVDDINGMNGFYRAQDIIYQIKPKNYLLSGKITTKNIIPNTKTTIDVEIKNEGTINYKGIYLSLRQDHTIPDSLTGNELRNITTEIPVNESKQIQFQYDFSKDTPKYIFLLDQNANVLDSLQIVYSSDNPNLSLENFHINCNSETCQENISDNGQNKCITYRNVYGDHTVNAYATISNLSDNAIVPSIICELFEYNINTQKFEPVTQQTSTYSIQENSTHQFSYSFKNLSLSSLYAIKINKKITAGNNFEIEINSDSILYFKMNSQDLCLEQNEDGSINVKGHWNKDIFTNKASNANICIYDLQNVIGLNSQPKAANPNALFYVTDTTAIPDGYNLISEGHCHDLRLINGYSFSSKTDFTAHKAQLIFNSTKGNWTYMGLPFDASVPNGCMARRIKKMSSMLISESDRINTVLKRGIPYLYKNPTNDQTIFKSTNVLVSTQNNSSSDSICITFSNKIGSPEYRILHLQNPNNFEICKSTDVIPSFSGFLNYDFDVSTQIFNYNEIDQASKILQDQLIIAYSLSEQYQHKVNEDIYDQFIETLEAAKFCYTHQVSTEEILHQTELLKEGIRTLQSNQFFTGEPIDFTSSFLQNPSFEERLNGWEVKKASGQMATAVIVNTTLDNFIVNNDQKYIFHSYSRTGKGSAQLSQNIKGLPSGYYKITFKGAVEYKDSITIKAGNRNLTVRGSDWGPRYLHSITIDSIIVNNGCIDLCIEGNNSWYKVDDFKLYLIGEIPTSIDEHSYNDNNFDIINIQEGGFTINSNQLTNIIITDISGRLIRKTSGKGDIKIQGLIPGIYIVNNKKILVK